MSSVSNVHSFGQTDVAVSTTICDVKRLFQYLGYSIAKAGGIEISEGDDTGLLGLLFHYDSNYHGTFRNGLQSGISKRFPSRYK